MTNGDRIRSMDNKELAEFLDKVNALRDISPLYCSLGACVHKKDCMAGQECEYSFANRLDNPQVIASAM